MPIYLVDAFTNTQFAGNRAGVVFDTGRSSREWKQKIAAEINASETVFASQIEANRFNALYFTPTTEIDFCGHATIALFHTLANQGKIELNGGTTELLVETQAGNFPIFVRTFGDEILVTMRQTKSHFAPPPCSIDEVAKALRLPQEALDTNFPLGLAKTGNWHLIIGVKSRTYLDQINYDSNALSKILNKAQAVTAHVFCKGDSGTFHARNFGPTIGIEEDPATGSAAGAFAAYLVNEQIIENGSNSISIAQGEKMGRPSQITLQIDSVDGVLQQVEITGTAVASFQLVQQN